MSSAIDLVISTGPLEGTRLELDPKETLRLGRTRAGIDFEDPLVSLNHASITFANNAYWVTDLRSASGTFVNGTELGEEAVRLKLGDVLRLGESEMRVTERPIQNLLRMVLIVCLILASTPLVYHFVVNQPLTYDPTIHLRGAVMGADGEHTKLTVPAGFIRREGVDHRGLQHTHTTDIDRDGVDEIWISNAASRFVVSLDSRGKWRYHGSVKSSCLELSGTKEAPQFDCGGIRWRWKDGSYQAMRLDGVMVFASPATGGPVQSFNVKGIEEADLAGWLGERGLQEPIHYLLCEGWVPGAPPQVLTESGAIRPLSKGCLHDIKVDVAGVAAGTPKAMAFTAAGVEALRADALMHLSGGVEGVFLGGAEAGIRDALVADPITKTRGKISFLAKGVEGKALAGESFVDGARTLLNSGRETYSSVVKAQLLSAGSARLDGGGCVQLEVTTHPWSCSVSKLCTSGSTFLSIDEVGCGERQHVLSVPYAGGTVYGRSGAVEVVAEVNSLGERWRTDVLRTQVYIRPTNAE